MRTTCLVASASSMFLQSIKILIKKNYPETEVLGAQTLEECLKLVENREKFCVLLDRMLLGVNIEAKLRPFFAINPTMPVGCFLQAPCNLTFGLRLVRNGITSIFYTSDSVEMIKVLGNFFKGIAYYPYEIAEAVRRREHLFKTQETAPLTEKEKFVLSMMVNGKTIKETVMELNVSRGTVTTIRQRIMKKLGTKSTIETVRMALESGYTKDGNGFYQLL